MSAQRNEEALLRAMRHGDEAALGEIIDQYTAYVGTIVWNIVKGKMDRDDAKEIVSDSFYVLWQNAQKVQSGKLKGYLGSIARSRSLNALRRAGWDEALEDDVLTLSVPGPEDEAMRRAEYAALRRSLDALGEPDRSIFIRHYYYCQSAREIAQALGSNVNTIHTRLRRGRERLKAELEQEEKGGGLVEQAHL